jgi:hypothetical protein
MADHPIRTYVFKQYRRTKPGGSVGELTKSVEICATGLSAAEEIAAKDHLAGIDFKHDFAILEGETGFVSCWLTGYPHA